MRWRAQSLDEDGREQLGGVTYWLRRDPPAQLSAVLHADDTALGPVCAPSVSKAFLRAVVCNFHCSHVMATSCSQLEPPHAWL